jgi:hypothetical protein
MQDKGHGQNLTNGSGYNEACDVNEQWHRLLYYKSAHHSFLPYGQEKPVAISLVLPSKENRGEKKP